MAATEVELLVPMTDAVCRTCRALLGTLTLTPPLTLTLTQVRRTCRALLGTRQWLAMARAVQGATDGALVAEAARLATEDRATYPSGGVLLVADTAAHAEALLALCSAAGVRAEGFASLEAEHAARVGVVVVTKDKDRGYNAAVRLGHMVTGAYAGNSASRHQLRGRLRRLGQVREAVRFTTVVMEHSLLHLLHQRHSSVDSMNISLEQLGETFGAEVLKGVS